MKVIKFFTLDQANAKLEKVVWYIEENMKPSKIVAKVETFLRINKLSCYLGFIKLYHSRQDFDKETEIYSKTKKLNIEYLAVGVE